MHEKGCRKPAGVTRGGPGCPPPEAGGTQDMAMAVYGFQGYSMFPFIRPGDRLVVTGRTGTAIGPGDIVLFRDRGGPSPAEAALVAHRVIRRSADGRLVTKGDNLPRFDPEPRPRSEILGKVIAVIRRGRMRMLHRGPYRLLGRAVAHYSARNLTPGLILSRLKAAARR